LCSHNRLMCFEETTGDPLVDCHTNHGTECVDTRLLVLTELGLVDGLEEEGGEGLKRVLVHMINDGQRDEHEVEHGTFGGDASVHLSQRVDVRLSHLGEILLLFDLSRGLLGLLQLVDQLGVLEDRSWVGIRKLLKQVGFKLSERDLELILLVHKLLFGLLEVGLLDTDDHGK